MIFLAMDYKTTSMIAGKIRSRSNLNIGVPSSHAVDYSNTFKLWICMPYIYSMQDI